MITQEEVVRLFDYREDGFLIRRISTGPRGMKGQVAGSIGKGGYANQNEYNFIKLNGRRYKSSHLIFLWHHGYIPLIVDHKNRESLDDRIENLRDSNHSENGLNSNRNDPEGLRIPEV